MSSIHTQRSRKKKHICKRMKDDYIQPETRDKSLKAAQQKKNDEIKYSLLKGPDVYKIMKENYWKFGC